MSRGGLTRRFPVLGIRDFRLLLADRLIAPASVGFSLVGVSFAVLKATNSATDLSYVLAAQIAPSLVFVLIGGVAADRFRAQRVIVAANLLMALGEGTFGILALAGNPPLWAMLGLEAVPAPGSRCSTRPRRRFSPHRPRRPAAGGERDQPAGDEYRPDAGAAAAGLLVAAAGPGWALVLCGAGMVATVPMLLAIRATGRARRWRSAPGQHAPGSSTAPAGACSPSCVRAGRSSGPTPGCG